MHRLIIALLLLVALPALAAWEALLAVEENVRLQTVDGAWVSGPFAEERDGMFLRTADGGKLYRWEELLPGSLPAAIRGRVRLAALNLAARADAIYRAGQVDDAKVLYGRVYLLAWYLECRDWQAPALADFAYRRHGWVYHEGAWMPYARQQQSLGRVEAGGRWLTPEQAAEREAFQVAMKAAVEAVDETHGALLLTEAIARYPASPYVPAAQLLREKLLAAAAAPAPRTAAENEQPSGPLRPSYTGLQVTREDRWYDRYDDRWFGRPTFVYGDGFQVVYPGFGWSPRHHRHDRHDRHDRCDDGSGVRLRIRF